MNITQTDLDQLQPLSLDESTHNNNGILYLKNSNTLYKVFEQFYSFQDEVERNIDFQIQNPIPHTPTIHDKIYIDGQFQGYSMEYITNSLTFRSAIGKELPVENKIEAIKNVYEALRCLHGQDIYLGDIHSDNFLIDQDGKGYIIDLECMRFKGDEYKFKQCYLVKPNDDDNKINVASKYTDNIKVMVSSLSLLLEIDLEKFISKKSYDINLEQIYEIIINPLNNEELDQYFKRLMNQEDVEYFDLCVGNIFNNEELKTRLK